MLYDSGVTFSWGMFVGYRWLDNGLSLSPIGFFPPASPSTIPLRSIWGESCGLLICEVSRFYGIFG